MLAKLHNKDGSLTFYGFMCGYRQTFKATNHEDSDYHYVCLELANSEINLFDIKGFYNYEHFWIQMTGLKKARQVYRKVISYLKKFNKEKFDNSYKDIINLDEK